MTMEANDNTPARRPTRVRHAVLWLTVLAYMITYMDRVVISTAAPSIQQEFGFSRDHHGLDLQHLPDHLRPVPDPGRLAGRPVRPARGR
jgi:hypothetical protein